MVCVVANNIRAVPAVSRIQSWKKLLRASADDFHIPLSSSNGIVIIFRCKAGGRMKDNAAIVKEPKIPIIDPKQGSIKAKLVEIVNKTALFIHLAMNFISPPSSAISFSPNSLALLTPSLLSPNSNSMEE
jgi:hypothetical protein